MMKLLDKHNLILKKHGSLRRKIILKRLSINKGEEQKIIQIIEDLQNEIDKKIKKTVIWKTN
jgi:ribosomal protein L18